MSSDILRDQKLEPLNPLFSLLSPEERDQILYWNNTYSQYNPELNFIAMFEEQVEKNPFAIALIYKDQVMNYKELNDQANQLAHYLQKNKLNSRIIAICLAPSFRLFIAILAIHKVGCAYLPLDPSFPKERLTNIITDAKVDAVILEKDYQDHIIHNRLINLDAEANQILIKQSSLQNLQNKILPKDLAYIIYTSGSTGLPKGVMITQQNLNHFFHWFADAIAIKTKDIFDFSSPISFDFTVPMTLFPLSRGCKICICEDNNKKDPFFFIKHLIKNKITITKLTPSYFRQLQECLDKEIVLPELRLIIFGGESIYKSDLQPWLTQFPHHTILNEYGPTEATVATTWLTLNLETLDYFNDNISIGKPAKNTQAYIVESDLHLCPIGKVGEILVGGDGVAVGYLNQPELSANKFIKNPFANSEHGWLYRTGDLGRYLPNGNIEFMGRIDHQVKIRGFRIELDEINLCLIQHPSVKQAVTIIKKNQLPEDSQIISYCVLSNLSPVTSNELREYLLNHLPEYMMPSIFIFVDKFPLNTNGKLDLKKLSQIGLRKLIKSPPSTETEIFIQKIWQSILQISDIDIQDNFFELGGNSLTAARMINRLRKATGKNISLIDLYEYPTLEKFAILISKKEVTESSLETKIKKNAIQKIPLSDMQLLFWLLERMGSQLKVPNIVKRIRVGGKIEKNNLEKACKLLFDRHRILTYQINLYPIQQMINNYKFEIAEQNISTLDSEDQEAYLQKFYQFLQTDLKWEKNKPLLSIKIFYLDDSSSELQFSLSHLVADDISMDIIIQDLSALYTGQTPITCDADFFDYILLEKNSLSTVSRDSDFWQAYLENASHIDFPRHIKLDKKTNRSTTTYLPISETTVQRLNDLASRSRINKADILCGTVAFILKKYLSSADTKNMIINFVRSTRDSEAYDHAVGLFVRNDLIKVNLEAQQPLEIAKTIKMARSDSAPYQCCPGIIKLAASIKKDWQGKLFLKWLISGLSILLTYLFRQAQLNPTVLNQYGKIFIAHNTEYIININILNTFFDIPSPSHTLFGLEVIKVNPFYNEKMSASNVLDFSFDRDEALRPCLIICSNLDPALRTQIGNEIIKIIETQLLKNSISA